MITIKHTSYTAPFLPDDLILKIASYGTNPNLFLTNLFFSTCQGDFLLGGKTLKRKTFKESRKIVLSFKNLISSLYPAPILQPTDLPLYRLDLIESINNMRGCGKGEISFNDWFSYLRPINLVITRNEAGTSIEARDSSFNDWMSIASLETGLNEEELLDFIKKNTLPIPFDLNTINALIQATKNYPLINAYFKNCHTLLSFKIFSSDELSTDNLRFLSETEEKELLNLLEENNELFSDTLQIEGKNLESFIINQAISNGLFLIANHFLKKSSSNISIRQGCIRLLETKKKPARPDLLQSNFISFFLEHKEKILSDLKELAKEKSKSSKELIISLFLRCEIDLSISSITDLVNTFDADSKFICQAILEVLSDSKIRSLLKNRSITLNFLNSYIIKYSSEIINSLPDERKLLFLDNILSLDERIDNYNFVKKTLGELTIKNILPSAIEHKYYNLAFFLLRNNYYGTFFYKIDILESINLIQNGEDSLSEDFKKLKEDIINISIKYSFFSDFIYSIDSRKTLERISCIREIFFGTPISNIASKRLSSLNSKVLYTIGVIPLVVLKIIDFAASFLSGIALTPFNFRYGKLCFAYSYKVLF